MLLNTTDVVPPEHIACDDGVAVATGIEFTVIVPALVTAPQPPVNVIIYGKVPDVVGVPLISALLADQLPLTPAGKPLKVAPVAPVVLYVILAIAVFRHFVWLSVPVAEINVIVLSGVTVIFPVLVTAPQPPVRVII